MNKQRYPIRGNGIASAFALDEMKIEIDGMKVILEKKVALLPVNVIESKNPMGNKSKNGKHEYN